VYLFLITDQRMHYYHSESFFCLFCLLYFIHVFHQLLVAKLQKMVFSLKLNLLFHLTDGAEHHAS
jgi:hypothetical protein